MLNRKHVIALAMSLIIPSVLASAHAGDNTSSLKLNQPCNTHILKLQKPHRGHRMLMIEHSWNRALRPARNYSTDEARILAQAAIVKYGDKKLKVGEIASFSNPKGRKLYNIQIIGKDSKVMKTLIMNPHNGHVRIKRNSSSR